jgi:hypothetical protein
MMKNLAIAGAGLLAIVLATVAGQADTSDAANGNGEGHTPVVVCHWVPAAPAGSHDIAGPEGGSYNVIVVDDDGANGNKNLRAHAHHEHDLIGSDEACGTGGGDDDFPGED